jgi:signal transduction histidine kinase
MKFKNLFFNFIKSSDNDLPKSELYNTIKEFEKRQAIYSFLGLLILIGISIVMNTLHLQSVAEQSTRYVTRMMQMGMIRDATYVLQESLKGNFETIAFKSSATERSFVLPASQYLESNSQNAFEVILRDKIIIPFEDSISGYTNEYFIFEYNRFALVPYAVFLWLLILLVTIPQTRLMKKKLTEQFDKDLILEKAKESNRISDEVRHNLRTPLASLLRIPSRLPESLKQDRELLKTSIEQIKKITSALDQRKLKVSGDDKNRSEEIFDSIIKSVNQISTTITSNVNFNFNIDDSLCSAKVDHIPVELQIIIGNVVNNSLDAFNGSAGTIELYAKDVDPYLQIEIIDNGPGIDSALREHIFDQGFTKGKINGTGLGLYHARTHVSNWGGQIKVDSEIGKGTRITLMLPIFERASWFVPRLKFKQSDKIYVLDDQLTGRQLWKLKLNECGINANIRFLANSGEAKVAFEEPGFDPFNSVFIFDYDLNENITGIDLLSLLPHGSHRILATGHFDKQEIRDLCEKHKVLLIPKTEIPQLPVVVI